MSQQIPDPIETAQQEAERINADREAALVAPLERVLADAPFLEREALLSGLEAFHRERMESAPSPAKYPESPPWVEFVLAVDREVQALAGLSDAQMAHLRSLHHYLTFRGHGSVSPATDEKCRVAYVPESNHGRIHFKNLDDPATWYKPEGEPTWLFPAREQTLWSDGVGSGLHLDDEPEEIFPLPVMQMFHHYVDDVPSAVEFLTRYSPFWGRCNILLHDSRKRTVAIEKCSYNFIEVFEPGPDGISHISGMTCRDLSSPLGQYQRAQRQKYLGLFGRPADCADNAFWDMARQFEEKLASALGSMDKPAKLEDLIRLFTTPWPTGLNKTGQRIHPEQGLIGYTLISYATLLDERKLLRWQRTALPELRYPDEPETFQF